MDAELKKEWIAALRSGEYRQNTDGTLRNDRGHCCLGVLGEILALRGKGKWCGNLFEGGRDTLPKFVAGPLGLETTRYVLACMNDGFEVAEDGRAKFGPDGKDIRTTPKTFVEIADYIEANL